MSALEERAREAAEQAWLSAQGALLAYPMRTQRTAIEVIESALLSFAAKAVEEERERCAQVAEKYEACHREDERNALKQRHHAGANRAGECATFAKAIAYDIRRPRPQSEGKP